MRKFLLLLILILGFLLRFYQLGANPISLDWDEASLGYNAYSLSKTGRDEYGVKLPFEFRSFGDYKPPFYVYATVPSVIIFGLNEFAVRLPSAIFGELTILLVYFLVRQLFPSLSNKYPLLASFLMAVSPWHIQFSRIAFEANIGLFWYLLAVYLLVKVSESKNYLIWSVFAFVLAIYSYHSLRLVVPVVVLVMLIFLGKQIFQAKKILVISVLLGLLLTLPILLSLKSGTKARFTSVTNLTPESLTSSIEKIEFDNQRGDFFGKLIHNRRIIYLLGTVKGYLDHWNFSFLFLKGDAPDRHHAPDMGMLYFIELPFVLLGLYTLIFLKKDSSLGKKTVLTLFFAAPLASALTTGTPHAVRALLYLPTYQIFITFGIVKIFGRFSTDSLNKLLILKLAIIMLYVFNMIYYLDMYYIHAPLEQAKSWQYGYKQVVETVEKIKSNDQKIVVTYKYDQPYIYFLFYGKIDPSWYQNNWQQNEIKRFERIFGQYVFKNIDLEKDSRINNSLLIGTPQEIPETTTGLIKEIAFPDGEIAFRIIQR